MMSKITFRCFGCGCELQNDNPQMTGYTPKPLGTDGAVLCQRCFRLQHYGENKDDSIAKPNYKEIFAKAIKKKNLIVYVIDLFNLEGSIIKEAHPFIQDNPVLVIANKRDILPKAVDDDKLRQAVYSRLQDEGLKLRDVLISSAYKNYNLDEIYHACKALRQGKDIYIIGASSVGKSSMINAMMKSYKNESRNLISTSPYPGTTVSTIRIPIDNKSTIIDTPGVLLCDSLISKVEKNTLKYVIPKTEIKPKTYFLPSEQCLIFGGLARLEIESGSKASYTVYCSNDVDVMRCKMDKANKTFDNLVTQKRIKPISITINGSENLVAHEFILPKNPVDLVIVGYLWVNIKGNGQKIIIKAPQGVDVLIRNPEI